MFMILIEYSFGEYVFLIGKKYIKYIHLKYIFQ